MQSKAEEPKICVVAQSTAVSPRGAGPKRLTNVKESKINVRCTDAARLLWTANRDCMSCDQQDAGPSALHLVVVAARRAGAALVDVAQQLAAR